MLAPSADPPVPLLDLPLGLVAVPAAAASYVLENACLIGLRRSAILVGESTRKNSPNDRYFMVGAPVEKCWISDATNPIVARAYRLPMGSVATVATFWGPSSLDVTVMKLPLPAGLCDQCERV